MTGAATITVPEGWQAAFIGCGWMLHHGGPDWFDCQGLVERAWLDIAGLDLSMFRGDPVSADPDERRAQLAGRVSDAIAGGRFIELARPVPLAIGVVNFKRFPVHVGLYARGGFFVHACEDFGAVRQDDVAAYCTSSGSRLHAWYWPREAALPEGARVR